MLPVVDQVWNLIFLGEDFILQFALRLMVRLEIPLIISDAIEKIIIVKGITNGEILGDSRESRGLPCEKRRASIDVGEDFLLRVSKDAFQMFFAEDLLPTFFFSIDIYFPIGDDVYFIQLGDPLIGGENKLFQLFGEICL